MEKFTKLIARAAYLDLINIDTDMIIPKQFLKTVKRTGLGVSLFYEMRYDKSGNKINNFILHQNSYKNSKILIAGDNFGCGSSREHADQVRRVSRAALRFCVNEAITSCATRGPAKALNSTSNVMNMRRINAPPPRQANKARTASPIGQTQVFRRPPVP